MGKQQRLAGLFVFTARLGVYVGRSCYFDHPLTNFHPLRRTCGGVGIEPAPLGPLVGLVVVVGVAKQKAAVRFVHDQAHIAPHTHRPKMLVFGLFNPVQLHARIGRVLLQVNGGDLDGLLLVGGQAG